MGGVLAIAGLFLLMRTPIVFRQIGGHDEEYISIAGWTILQDGVPRMPYVPPRDPNHPPDRDPNGAYAGADEALFAYPPLFYYAVAATFFVLGPSEGAAQFASMIAGLVALGLVFRFARGFLKSDPPALLATGIYALSGMFTLSATHARPDMLCAMFGLGSVLASIRWIEVRRWPFAGLSGLLAGLALMSHPFGLVMCLQVGMVPLLLGRSWRERFLGWAIVTAAALLATLCWAPLILAYPRHFEQFRNNVLNRAGPGLPWRFLTPWKYLAAQGGVVWEKFGAGQTCLFAFGLMFVTARVAWKVFGSPWRGLQPTDPLGSDDAARAGARGSVAMLAWTWSSVILLAIVQGSHTLPSYWCYPACFASIALADSLWSLFLAGSQGDRKVRWWGLIFVAAACGLLLPGAGFRAIGEQLTHWSDPDYSRPRFTAKLIEMLPADKTYLVDPEYVFAFQLAGRKTILSGFEGPEKYDYVVAGPSSIGQDLPRLQGERRFSLGKKDNPFACYAEVFAAP